MHIARTRENCVLLNVHMYDQRSIFTIQYIDLKESSYNEDSNVKIFFESIDSSVTCKNAIKSYLKGKFCNRVEIMQNLWNCAHPQTKYLSKLGSYLQNILSRRGNHVQFEMTPMEDISRLI